jgi:DNA-binding NtrC family response regulator
LEVLVASSDGEKRSALVSILGQCGVKTLIARSVYEVQAALAGLSIDMVLCDETLPGGGFRFVLLLTKTIGAGTPLVLCSLLGDVDRYLEAIELGVLDFIAPPFRPADVNLIIASVRQIRTSNLTQDARSSFGRRQPQQITQLVYDC